MDIVNSLPMKLSRAKVSKKSLFTQKEDKKLKEIVLLNGAHGWSKIAMKLPGRTARQCRDRWVNYLDPLLSDKEWTKEEDKLLLDMYKEFGTHWKDISMFFEGRSLNSIRNRVFKLERRKNSKFHKDEKQLSNEEAGMEKKSNANEHKNSDNAIFDFKDVELDFLNGNGIFGCLEDWDFSNHLNK